MTGASRGREALGVAVGSVNGAAVSLAELLVDAAGAEGFAAWRRAMVDAAVLRELAAARGVSVTDEERAAEAARVRRALSLDAAADALAWLDARELSIDAFARHVDARVLRAKLRALPGEAEVAACFAQDAAYFDAAVLSYAVVDAADAERFAARVAAARSLAAALADPCVRRAALRERTWRRDLEPRLAARVFAARAGDTLGVVARGGELQVLHVDAVLPATLTDAVREEVRDVMLANLLAAAARRASVRFDLRALLDDGGA